MYLKHCKKKKKVWFERDFSITSDRPRVITCVFTVLISSDPFKSYLAFHINFFVSEMLKVFCCSEFTSQPRPISLRHPSMTSMKTTTSLNIEIDVAQRLCKGDNFIETLQKTKQSFNYVRRRLD